jgi:raffinose/stachyose/melibiose transport system permease protein
MNKTLCDKKAIVVFLLPASLFFAVFIVIPACVSLYYSLNSWNGIGAKIWCGLHNYVKLFVNNQDGFAASMVHAVWIAVASVFIQLPISLFFAIVLARGVRGERFYITVFFIPVVISTTVIAQLWAKIYHPTIGLLNVFLRAVGLGSWARSWLAEPKLALIAVIVPILWQYVGYHMLMMYTAIKAIPQDLFEAAQIDGAGPWHMAFHITIPLIRPILKVCITFAIVGSLKSFDLIYAMTQGGPMGATDVPSTVMVETIFRGNQFGYGSAMAMMIIFMCLLSSLLVKKFFRVEPEEN